MKTLKSSTGRKFEITSNKSARTFTIRVDGSKYRTYPFRKEEFNEASYWTGEDWHHFLRNTNDYYKVK
jgi:hypothetical protein